MEKFLSRKNVVVTGHVFHIELLEVFPRKLGSRPLHHERPPVHNPHDIGHFTSTEDVMRRHQYGFPFAAE
jgi:hypothetical protein